jgi:hypothetical protein
LISPPGCSPVLFACAVSLVEKFGTVIEQC